MSLNQRLYDVMAPKAARSEVGMVCVGLGYTAVTLAGGGIGLAYTYFETKAGCTMGDDYVDFEGRPALDLLERITWDSPLERSKALALINALNHDRLVHLPPDKENDLLFDVLKIGPGSRLAMVGLSKPLIGMLESRGAAVEVIDEFQGIGEKQTFYRRLSQWADTALITSTAILNGTLEELLGSMGPGVRAAVMGPGTPLVATVFAEWPAVRALAGTVPLAVGPVLKAVRHGLGTPDLHRHSRKATIIIRE
jgi:uncharacterized protein (DUF4213/DUF364 family)